MRPVSPFLKAARQWSAVVASLVWLPFAANADVRLSGLDAAQEQNVRVLVPLATTECDANRWRVERLFRDADEDVRNALRALGYYDITIDKRLTWTDECWQAEIDVAIGEPVQYRTVDIRVDGEPLAVDENSILAVLRPDVGEVLHHGNYEQFKSTLMQQLSAQGYFDATYSRKEVIVETDSSSADLYLYVDRGPRYRFGSLSFSDGILREDLLRSYTDIREGDYYSAREISRLYESLNGSGYFSQVSIRTDPVDEVGHTAPVDVTLRPGIRRNYSIGAGLATDTGPQGRLGYINRRRNDRGHQVEARLFVSDTDSEATASYRWPMRDPRTDWASVITGVQHEDTDTSENDTFKLGYLRTKSLSDNWLWTRSIDYSYEEFRVGDQDDSSQLIILGVNFESAVGREISRSTRGRRINFDIRGASDSLGSDTSFLQFRVNAKFLRSLSDRYRVILRGSLGTTIKDEFEKLPVSARFFAGGDRSVRGYGFESLGPTNADGEVIGGSHLIEASVEFDRMLTDKWSIAAFMDAGSAFSNEKPELSTGVGLGVRWYSPVGPLRLDFAHPLDDPDQRLRVHIVLGPDL